MKYFGVSIFDVVSELYCILLSCALRYLFIHNKSKLYTTEVSVLSPNK